MKIGILTQPLHANYGGILQNYALQTVLKRMGHEVWTMDYLKYTWLNWFNNAWRILAHKMLGHDVKFSKTPSARKVIERPLRRFVNEKINLTTPRTKHVERQIVEKFGFEGIIVGSDQVWRTLYNEHIEDMFLYFLNGMKIKRIAYAASFGTDEWEFTTEQTNICATLAQKFDAISVREASGVSLCRNHLNVEATNVLDPTLLLTAEDYTRLCIDIPRKKPFLFAYILDQSEEKIKMITDFASTKGLPYLIQSAGPAIEQDDSIELWLSQFRDAAYVITDSFHGTAFSINFGKDFYVFSNTGRGNSRFESLLGQLGLSHRIVSKNCENCSTINWTIVNLKLEELRRTSLEWLSRALAST